MKTSEQINEIAAAMSKAQAMLAPAIKDSTNPHFRSKYADLTSVWDAARPALAANALAALQDVTNEVGGVAVTTRITHSSGQWIEFGPLVVPMAKMDAHGLGSATSYGKRYGLSAALGITADDDDGNAAIGRPSESSGIHSPKGDLGKQIPPDQAMATATAMRGILEADLDEKMMALRVLDKHDILNKDADLYVAASDCLSSSERAAWKKIVAFGKAAQKAEPASRRF